MGDHNGGDAEFLLKLAQLHLHRFAQLGVERGKRLIEKNKRGETESARAMATRWRWPPESWEIARLAKPGRWTSASSSSTRFLLF